MADRRGISHGGSAMNDPFPPALSIYVGDIHDALSASMHAMSKLYEARIAQHTQSMRDAAHEIAQLAHRANVLACVLESKIRLHQNRDTRVRS